MTHSSEKDEFFADMVLRCWGVASGKDYVSPDRINALEIILYEKIRQRTFVKTDEGCTAEKMFKYFDLEDNGHINFSKFKSAVSNFGCTFNDNEL